MAGFAVVMTILTYGIIGILGAGALSIALFFLARKKLRNEGRNDRSLVVRSTVAPFLGLAWLIVALLIHVQISNKLAH
jgi:O-antigen ligase